MINLEKYLQIESDDEILDFKIDNVPLWLIVRTRVIYNLMLLNEKMENSYIKISPINLSLKEKLNYIYYTLIKNPFLTGKKVILIIGSVRDNIKRDNFYFNHLYYKILENFNSVLLEQSFRFSYKQPKRENTLYIDLIYVISELLSKIKKLSKKEIKTVDLFLEFFENRVRDTNLLINDDFLTNLRDILYKAIKSYKIKKFLFLKLLKKIEPKLLIVQCAHYFSHYPLVLVAKEKGIKVAEYQHGYIGSDHYAYNFHPSVRNKVKKYLPDYMLTWGKYWSDNINTPAQKVEIGNFLLDDILRKSEKIGKGKRSILIVSSGKYPREYVLLGKEIKKHFLGYELYFRPHPSEVPAIKERYDELIKIGYKIDIDNLYTESLPRSEIVISLERSTVLYEAMLYTNKVFLITEKKDNKFPFYQVNSVKELKDYIDKINNLETSVDEQIWEKNPVEKFKKFLEKEIF